MEDHEDFGAEFILASDLARQVREGWIQLSDTDQAIVTALFELKHRAPQQYAVFVLRHIKGFVPTQIASLLEISVDTVYQHDHRARATLARNLAAYDEIQSWLRATGRRPGAGTARSNHDGERDA